MMTRRGLLGLAGALGLALVLTGCGVRSETFRYRMTVEVETPQGLRTGSSVIEIRYSEMGKDAWATPEARGVTSRARGEAVAVDLPDGRVLFALLRAPNRADGASMYPFGTSRTPRFEGEYANIRAIEQMKREAAIGTLVREAYPMLVTFADLDDPTSVALVDPDDLAATFGEGVSLKRITVQITDEPVTTGIEKRLGWLVELRGSYLHDGSTSRGAPLGLHGGNFSTERFE